MEAAGYIFISPAAIKLNPHGENMVDFKANTACKTKKHLPAIDLSSQVSY